MDFKINSIPVSRDSGDDGAIASSSKISSSNLMSFNEVTQTVSDRGIASALVEPDFLEVMKAFCSTQNLEVMIQRLQRGRIELTEEYRSKIISVSVDLEKNCTKEEFATVQSYSKFLRSLLIQSWPLSHEKLILYLIYRNDRKASFLPSSEFGSPLWRRILDEPLVSESDLKKVYEDLIVALRITSTSFPSNDITSFRENIILRQLIPFPQPQTFFTLFPNESTASLVRNQKLEATYKVIIEGIRFAQWTLTPEIDVISSQQEPAVKEEFHSIMVRYKAACDVLQMPAFPITPWRVWIFLARIGKNIVAQQIQTLVPEASKYPLLNPAGGLSRELVAFWINCLATVQERTERFWIRIPEHSTLSVRMSGLALLTAFGFKEVPVAPIALIHPVASLLPAKTLGPISPQVFLANIEQRQTPDGSRRYRSPSLTRTPPEESSRRNMSLAPVRTIPTIDLTSDDENALASTPILIAKPVASTLSLNVSHQPLQAHPLLVRRDPPLPPSLNLRDYYPDGVVPFTVPLPTIPSRVVDSLYDLSQEPPRKKFIKPGIFTRASSIYTKRIQPKEKGKEKEKIKRDDIIEEDDSSLGSDLNLEDDEDDDFTSFDSISRSIGSKRSTREAAQTARRLIENYNDLTLRLQGKIPPPRRLATAARSEEKRARKRKVEEVEVDSDSEEEVTPSKQKRRNRKRIIIDEEDEEEEEENRVEKSRNTDPIEVIIIDEEDEEEGRSTEIERVIQEKMVEDVKVLVRPAVKIPSCEDWFEEN